MTADVLSPTWAEEDIANSGATQPSWPENMPGRNINDAARAMMGAIKRWANQINATVTTTGTGAAYLANYGIAPSSLFDGQRFCIVAHAANSAVAPTLSINGTVRPINKIVGGSAANLALGDIQANFVMDLVFKAAAAKFILINAPSLTTTTPPPPSGSVAWGSITGTLASQADLKVALDAKATIASVTAAIQTEIGNAQAGNYTLIATDAGKMLTFGAAAVVTVNTGVLAANSRVDLIQIGAGVVSFAGTATRLGKGTKLNGQYAGATLWFPSPSQYIIVGDIVP